jgi:hypothetical protein
MTILQLQHRIKKQQTYKLHSVIQWLIDNKLFLHLDKTETILFGSKHMLKTRVTVNVSCKGTDIQSTLKDKYLDTSLDHSLCGELTLKRPMKGSCTKK